MTRLEELFKNRARPLTSCSKEIFVTFLYR